jgi:N-acetylmuramic acid 6-phosphate (MurNAc-6-P) etherase
LILIIANRRNLKQNKSETKQKKNKKEVKTAIIFAFKQNEAKQNQNFFASMRKKCFFTCFCI